MAPILDFPGHCYLQWFQGDAFTAASRLDGIVTVAELRRVANAYALPFAPGTFGLRPEVVDGKAVWHVVDGLWSAATCLASIDRTALVGAAGESAGTAHDVTRQVHEIAEKVEHVATEVAPPPGVLRRRFYFSFTLGGSAGEPVSYNLFPNSIPRVVAVSRLFESVRLVATSVEIVVEASTTARVGVGLNSSNTHARDIGHVRRMAHNMVAYSKVDAPRVTVWDLPDRMTFGREYKMTSVGNGPAFIAFHYAGGVTESAEVNGFMEIEFAGEGVTQPIRIDPSEQKGVVGGAVGPVAANTSRRRIPVNVDAEESEAEEEEDDE